MAQPSDLLGLGLPVYIANLVGTTVASVTCGGTSAGSATQMPGPNRLFVVNASNGGTGLLVPAVTGDVNKANLADRILVANLLGAAVQVYANNTAQGSAVTFIIDGGSLAGTVGVSVSAGKTMELLPISVSTWIGIRSA